MEQGQVKKSCSDDGFSSDASTSESEAESLDQLEQGHWAFVRGDPTGYWFNAHTRRSQWASPGSLTQEELALARCRRDLDGMLVDEREKSFSSTSISTLSPRAERRIAERDRRRVQGPLRLVHEAWRMMAKRLQLVDWVQTKFILQSVRNALIQTSKPCPK